MKIFYLQIGLLIVAFLIALINALLYWFDYNGNYMFTIIVVLIIFSAILIQYFSKNK